MEVKIVQKDDENLVVVAQVEPPTPVEPLHDDLEMNGSETVPVVAQYCAEGEESKIEGEVEIVSVGAIDVNESPAVADNSMTELVAPN